MSKNPDDQVKTAGEIAHETLDLEKHMSKDTGDSTVRFEDEERGNYDAEAMKVEFRKRLYAEKPNGSKADTGTKYLRTIRDKTDPTKTITTDLYGIIDGVGLPYLGSDGADAAIHHACKKILFAGSRGTKDTLTDLREAVVSLQRAIELARLEGKS